MSHFPKPFYRKSRQLWYVQVGGKQLNLGPDRDEAFRQYHQMMVSPEPTVAPPAESPQLVAELCDRYLAWVAAHRSPKTYEGYQYRLQRFIDCNPELTVDALRPYHVQEWVDRYTLSPSSCRSYMGSVKTCLRWCSKQGYIDKNPLQHMEMPAMGRRDQYVSPEGGPKGTGPYIAYMDLSLLSDRGEALGDFLCFSWLFGLWLRQQEIRCRIEHFLGCSQPGSSETGCFRVFWLPESDQMASTSAASVVNLPKTRDSSKKNRHQRVLPG